MRRQQILTQLNGPRVWAVFNEAALRLQPGEPTIMRTQIEHLIEISMLPNVTIQLIPMATRIQAVIACPITLLSFHVHELPDVVYLEQLTTSSYLCHPDHVSRYAQVLTSLSAEALQPAETAGHLRQLLQGA
jgi:hypothetical protein